MWLGTEHCISTATHSTRVSMTWRRPEVCRFVWIGRLVGWYKFMIDDIFDCFTRSLRAGTRTTPTSTPAPFSGGVYFAITRRRYSCVHEYASDESFGEWVLLMFAKVETKNKKTVDCCSRFWFVCVRIELSRIGGPAGVTRGQGSADMSIAID